MGSAPGLCFPRLVGHRNTEEGRILPLISNFTTHVLLRFLLRHSCDKVSRAGWCHRWRVSRFEEQISHRHDAARPECLLGQFRSYRGGHCSDVVKKSRKACVADSWSMSIIADIEGLFSHSKQVELLAFGRYWCVSMLRSYRTVIFGVTVVVEALHTKDCRGDGGGSHGRMIGANVLRDPLFGGGEAQLLQREASVDGQVGVHMWWLHAGDNRSVLESLKKRRLTFVDVRGRGNL